MKDAVVDRPRDEQVVFRKEILLRPNSNTEDDRGADSARMEHWAIYCYRRLLEDLRICRLRRALEDLGLWGPWGNFFKMMWVC